MNFSWTWIHWPITISSPSSFKSLIWKCFAKFVYGSISQNLLLLKKFVKSTFSNFCNKYCFHEIFTKSIRVNFQNSARLNFISWNFCFKSCSCKTKNFRQINLTYFTKKNIFHEFYVIFILCGKIIRQNNTLCRTKFLVNT